LRNADAAVSSGVSSGEAISSKQKRHTGARHETESAPPSALPRLQLRDGAAAGQRAAREVDSAHVTRARRAEPPLLEAAPRDAAASIGGLSVGGEAAGPDARRAGQAAGTGRRRAREEAGASDLAVVLSPAGGVATGDAAEDPEEDVRRFCSLRSCACSAWLR
jgi:hypothetical protein